MAAAGDDVRIGCSAMLFRIVSKPALAGSRESLHTHAHLCFMPVGCLAAAVVQEASRLVRCRDSPLNSVLGGAATGALLFKSHGELGGWLLSGAAAAGIN